MSTYYVPGTGLNPVHVLTHVISHNSPMRWTLFISHFTAEETEAVGG